MKKTMTAVIMLALLTSCGSEPSAPSSIAPSNPASNSAQAQTPQDTQIYTDDELAKMLNLAQLIIDNNLTFTMPIEQAEKGAFISAYVSDASFYTADSSTIALADMVDILENHVNTDALDENIAFNYIDAYNSDTQTLSIVDAVKSPLKSELLFTQTDKSSSGNDIVILTFVVYDTVPKEIETTFIKVDDIWKIRSATVNINSTLDMEKLASEGFNIGGENVLYTYDGQQTTVQIPDDILTIGTFAFYGRDDVTEVAIANTVTEISDKAFASCGLSAITIPESVENIGVFAFANYNPETDNSSPVAAIDGKEISSALTSVVIEDGVKSIGYGAFADCAVLTAVTIPASVQDMDDDIFKGCTALSSITVKAGSVAESYAKENGFEVEYY